MIFDSNWHQMMYNAVRGKHNMTREEAISKLNPQIYDPPTATHLVEALEALGLIKFERPGNEIANQIGYSLAGMTNVRDLTGLGHRIINDLKTAGYKIVKQS